MEMLLETGNMVKTALAFKKKKKKKKKQKGCAQLQCNHSSENGVLETDFFPYSPYNP